MIRRAQLKCCRRRRRTSRMYSVRVPDDLLARISDLRVRARAVGVRLVITDYVVAALRRSADVAEREIRALEDARHDTSPA